MIDYDSIMNEIRTGKSMGKICREREHSINNVRNQLKKRFPEEYDLYIHGMIIDEHNGYELRKIPENQTNRIETDLTKKAKQILRDYHNLSYSHHH